MALNVMAPTLRRGGWPSSGEAFNITGVGYLFAWGTSVPADATANKYAPGCLFLHTDGSGEGVLYVNQGTYASCDFNTLETGSLETDLASTATGKGASKIGVFDTASYFTGTTVEAVLAEIWAKLILKTTPGGASYIGVFDTAGYYTGDTVEAVLAEIGNPATALPIKTMGAATPALYKRLGKTATEGTEWYIIDEEVTLTNAVETNLTTQVPANSVILTVQANLNTAVTGDASGDDGLTKVGIGITSDPDKYGKTAALTKNAKSDFIPAWALLSSAETVCVKAADNAGAAVTEKFTAGGKVRVRIVYITLNSLDDAA